MTNKTYRILLDGKWSLEDLNVFSRVYFQNYSFIYCLETNVVDVAKYRIEKVLDEYELRSGLSYVSIYDIFGATVQKSDLPQIDSIKYSSPGWLDLILNLDVAIQFAKSLAVYLSAPIAAAESYKRLHKIYIELDKRRSEAKLQSLKLKTAQAKAAEILTKQLAKGIGFNSLDDLNKHTKDEEETARLLLAHHRRITRIAQFVKSGKASFPIQLPDQG